MKGVWWCDRCQVPLLTAVCEICGQRFTSPVAKDLVPVFAEETALLRDNLYFSALPKRARDFYLWVWGTAYYRLGNRVATLSIPDPDRPSLTVSGLSGIVTRPKHATRLSSLPQRIYAANRTRIESLEHEALEFIRDAAGKFEAHVPVVAFSGGKDSTVVSALVCKALGQATILHVMADTTMEAPDTYKYLDSFQDAHPRVPFMMVSPQIDFYKMCQEIGPPSRILRWCCTSHKAAPIATVVRALRHSHSQVLTFDGIRAAESARRRQYSRITHTHKIAGEVLASPILSWSSLDVWTYIIARQLPFNRGYRIGFRRMGCLPCPFNSKWSRFLTGASYPVQNREWASFLQKHGERIGHPRPEHFAFEGWRTRVGGRGMPHQRASLEKETCLREDRTFAYTLSRNFSGDMLEYLKPFGRFHVTYDDGCILRGVIADGRTRQPLVSLKVIRVRNLARFQIAERKNLRLFVQRVERQLRKFQSCIRCGGCAAVCPTGALMIDGRFRIDVSRCVGCLKCVSASCLAEESLKAKGQKSSWRVCDGSV